MLPVSAVCQDLRPYLSRALLQYCGLLGNQCYWFCPYSLSLSFKCLGSREEARYPFLCLDRCKPRPLLVLLFLTNHHKCSGIAISIHHTTTLANEAKSTDIARSTLLPTTWTCIELNVLIIAAHVPCSGHLSWLSPSECSQDCKNPAGPSTSPCL